MDIPWDGKNLAVIQLATLHLRVQGAPAAHVDRDWNLTVSGKPVAIGEVLHVSQPEVMG